MVTTYRLSRRSSTMRENTRCEVEEPISTPTLRTTISSSSTRERPVLEKKIRPPCASSITSGADKFWDRGALHVKGALHAARHAFRLELGFVLRTDEGILHPVWNGGTA